MVTAREIIDIYLSFFEKRGHTQIPNAPLVPQNDPTTLFTSSGMQPLVSYLLGETHPQGKRLVNVQNCFRTQDIDEIGDNRHTTFFRMLGNWSLGDYFKKEQLPWFFEFLTKALYIDPERLYVSVFQGFNDISKDEEAAAIWKELFASVGIDAKDRIFYYGVDENWWSKAGLPQDMPSGEPGGPDSEVFFDFYPEQGALGNNLNVFSHNGRLLEIGNSVFMQYQKMEDGGFQQLSQKNVDFGGGLERLLSATQGKQDMFQTNLFAPIIQTIEKQTEKDYQTHASSMRIVTDHLVAGAFIIANNVTPSNKEQGYILRRLIRRGLDHFYQLQGKELNPLIETIASQYQDTDGALVDAFEKIKRTILSEEHVYKRALEGAKKYIEKKYQGKIVGGDLKGVREISSEDAFSLYTTHGLSPTQIKSLGYAYNERSFSEKMKEHQNISRIGAAKKFAGTKKYSEFYRTRKKG